MSRHHGARGRVYMALTSAGTAESVATLNAWTFSAVTDKVDVTSFGDANHQYVTGLPDASGTFAGWFDDATTQTYTAASDGVARKFYLYPDLSNTPTNYFFGSILPDFSIAGSTSSGVSFTASWNAASIIVRNP